MYLLKISSDIATLILSPLLYELLELRPSGKVFLFFHWYDLDCTMRLFVICILNQISKKFCLWFLFRFFFFGGGGSLVGVFGVSQKKKKHRFRAVTYFLGWKKKYKGLKRKCITLNQMWKIKCLYKVLNKRFMTHYLSIASWLFFKIKLKVVCCCSLFLIT